MTFLSPKDITIKMADQNILTSLGFHETTIPEQKSYDGLPFPLVVEPAVSRTIQEWCSLVKENRSILEELTRKYGAILFKRFPIDNPECFDKFSGMYTLHHMALYNIKWESSS